MSAAVDVQGAPAESRVQPDKHGTHSGFNSHRYYGEEPCASCWDGERTFNRERMRDTRGAKRRARVARRLAGILGQQRREFRVVLPDGQVIQVEPSAVLSYLASGRRVVTRLRPVWVPLTLEGLGAVRPDDLPAAGGAE